MDKPLPNRNKQGRANPSWTATFECHSAACALGKLKPTKLGLYTAGHPGGRLSCIQNHTSESPCPDNGPMRILKSKGLA